MFVVEQMSDIRFAVAKIIVMDLIINLDANDVKNVQKQNKFTMR